MIAHWVPRWVLAFAVLLAGTQPAIARRQTADEPPPRWSAAADLSFDGSAGNEEFLLLSTGGRISHLIGDMFELDLSGQVRYGWAMRETNGVRQRQQVAQSLRGQLTFDLYPAAVWSPFAFGSAERNPLRRLDLRANGGAGVKYSFWQGESGNASISVAGLFSYEDYGASLSSALDQFQSKARWSWRPKAEWRPRSGIVLTHTTFYQPLWNSAADHLVDSRTALRVRLTDRVGMSFAYQYDRDSQAPLREAEKVDHRLLTGFDFRTEW